MANSLPLTKKKNKWVENRNVILRGQQLNYNASLQRKYTLELKKMTKKMIDETNKQLKKLFNGEIADDFFSQQENIQKIAMDASISSQARILTNYLLSKFNKLFSSKSKDLASKMVINSSEVSKSTLHSSLGKLSGGLSIKTGIIPTGMEDVSTAIIAENVSLIKSIPQEYFKNVTGAVMRSITTGNGIHDLAPEIQKYGKQTQRRAQNIALDQTRKAYNNINKQRLVSIGVKKFEWIHSYGGVSPRKSHIKIDGHIFSFENLEAEQAELGVPESDRGIPGNPINCRCTINPVIDFSDDND
jgi:SPP1 gp7 family putative phage head morphogenesis protein